MSEPKRILIVGGVAGGASAAARARRVDERAEIILFERGQYISFANCGLPYHIGGAIADRKRLLVQTPEAMRRRFNIDVRVQHEVLKIDRASRQVTVRDSAAGREYVERYDELILSPGAEPIRPPIPGRDLPNVLTLRSMADMDAIAQAAGAASPPHAVIVGGGYIGLEMAEALRARKLGVTLVEMAEQVFSAIDPEMATPIHHHLRNHGVDLRLRTSVTEIKAARSGLNVSLSSGESVACGLVILAIGVRPDAKLAREAGLALGPGGGIAVDEHMRTSDEHIFAVGDAAEVVHFVSGQAALMPLAGPANRQGRIAADNALGCNSVYRRTQGTAICKVFDLAVGMTGLSERALARLGRPCEKVYVHPSSHASYYPGAMAVSLKLLFDPGDGRILGAQAVGERGVDKRIDVLAVALRAGMTVFDLEDLELSYAPPFGSAKDPINYAGFVAANALRGDVKLCHTADVLSPRDNQKLLDVRTRPEVEAGTIPGSLHIPVDDLRQNLALLPRDKELLVFCAVGLRGYLACRILSQNGFACRNLTGGYRTYQAAIEVQAAPPSKQMPGGEVRDDAGQGVPPADPAKGNKGYTGVGACCAAAVDGEVVKQVDATGLQCPGPILRLKEELDRLPVGQALRIKASDTTFPRDVTAWCHSTGNELIDVKPENGAFAATIRRRPAPVTQVQAGGKVDPKNKTIIVFSGDFDKVTAGFIIANGAASMGSNVTMFFTFWGLNALRRPEAVSVKKTIVERMFGWMMPRGADKLALSKMHMGGMGLAMIKGIMRKKNVPSLPELIASAKKSGIRLVACNMTMDLMGIKREELIEGIEEGGVAMYLDRAEAGNVNLFI